MVDFRQLIGITKKSVRKSNTCTAAASQCRPPCQGDNDCQQANLTKEEVKTPNIVLKSNHSEYEILSELGKGVYGKVMKCRETGSKEFVAVKVLNSSPRFLEAGRKEVQFLSQLRAAHCGEHIVRCLEWFEHCQRTCIVFEMLGQTLQQLAAQRAPAPLPLVHTRHVLWQLCSALYQLESLGIVHADVKPDNIMVTNDCCASGAPLRVKLIDFSCAMTASECSADGCAHGNGRGHFTYAQTRHFRAPEVLLGAGLGPAADVWSLGCVAGGLLLGRTLFPGSSEYDQLRFICAAQGTPAPQTTSSARRAGVFFRLEVVGGQARLGLKTEEEVEGNTGRRQLVNDLQRPLRSLDELGPRHVRALARCTMHQDNCRNEPGKHDAHVEFTHNAPTVQLTPAAEALHLCVGLVKAMLEIDQTQRIRPVEALAHPFFVLPAPAADQPPEDYGDFSTAALIGHTCTSSSPSPSSLSSVDSSIESLSSGGQAALTPAVADVASSDINASTSEAIAIAAAVSSSSTKATTATNTAAPVRATAVNLDAISTTNLDTLTTVSLRNTPTIASISTYTIPSSIISNTTSTIYGNTPSISSTIGIGSVSINTLGTILISNTPASSVTPLSSISNLHSAPRVLKPVSCRAAGPDGPVCPVLSRWARRGRALSNFLRARHDSCLQ